MTSVKMPHDAREELTSVALAIFTDVSNAGYPIQDAILAVYLSGLEHATTLSKGTPSA